jgi:hypothetical protein
VDACTGISEKAATNVQVYPNPAGDVLHIRFENHEGAKNCALIDGTERLVSLSMEAGGKVVYSAK